MPAWRLSMRKIKEILRLKFENHLTNRRIARSCNISRPTVAHSLAKANAAGLSWPITEGLDDLSLEKLLFPLPRGETPGTQAVSKPCRPQPDLPRIHQELHCTRRGKSLYFEGNGIVPGRKKRCTCKERNCDEDELNQ